MRSGTDSTPLDFLTLARFGLPFFHPSNCEVKQTEFAKRFLRSIMSPITVFLADDHALVREGLRLLIQNQPDMQVVAKWATAKPRGAACANCSPRSW